MSVDLNRKLSPNFTLGEMIASQAASRRGIDNTPGIAATAALEALCQNVLQPVRDNYGPVIVSSGYRSRTVNRAIGGSGNSQHCLGQAADFRVSGESNLAVCQWIMRNLKFDQLIYEFGERGWVHCSYRVGRLRHEVRRAIRDDGKVLYPLGLAA